MSKKKGWILAAAGLLIVAGAAVGAWFLTKEDEKQVYYKATTVERGDLVSGVTESGSLSISTLTQSYELESSTSSSSGSSMNAMGMSASTGSSSSSDALVIDEVLVSPGQMVTEGDPIYTITQDSIDAMRTSLQEAIDDAQLEVTQASINRQSSLAQAQAEYDLNIAKGKTAQSTYDSTIASLAYQVTQAQNALDTADERIADIPGEIEDLEEELEKASDAMTKASLESQIDALEKELENYEDSYSDLEAKLTNALNNQQTQSIQAKATYDQTMLNYQNAKTIYNAAINGVDDSLTSAKEALEDAEAALEEFETYIADGTLYAAYTGMIYTVGYASGDELSTSTALLTYGDTEGITISVDVSEEDIAQVTEGDTVRVKLNAYPDTLFTGTVDEIATSASNSATVSYAVTVIVHGDPDLLYSGMTGEVTFVAKELTDVVYVSNKAIVLVGTKSYVNILGEDGVMYRQEVTTGFSNGVYVEILDGLTEGQTVYIESEVSSS